MSLALSTVIHMVKMHQWCISSREHLSACRPTVSNLLHFAYFLLDLLRSSLMQLVFDAEVVARKSTTHVLSRRRRIETKFRCQEIDGGKEVTSVDVKDHSELR